MNNTSQQDRAAVFEELCAISRQSAALLADHRIFTDSDLYGEDGLPVASETAGAEPGGSPVLSRVLESLRAEQARLRRSGIASLWVFGSVMHGDAHAGSDVDLFAEFDPGAKPSLVRLSSLRAELSDLLGTPVDLVERSAFHPAIREAAERDAVQVF